MRRLRRGKKSLTVRHHKRTFRSRLGLARMWERAGEFELARLESSRATFHCRAAEIKRELADDDERKAS